MYLWTENMLFCHIDILSNCNFVDMRQKKLQQKENFLCFACPGNLHAITLHPENRDRHQRMPQDNRTIG